MHDRLCDLDTMHTVATPHALSVQTRCTRAHCAVELGPQFPTPLPPGVPPPPSLPLPLSFDPSLLLGEGGFGRVYRGRLASGEAVAVKRLTAGGQQGDREFVVEVEMLSRLHHRHLVKLLGFCAAQHHGHQLLCYELMANGSLESWLHGEGGEGGREGGREGGNDESH